MDIILPPRVSTVDITNDPHLLLCMVGLPARGKSSIARKIQQYLKWLDISIKVFNLGEYRRKIKRYSDHSFFEQDNEAGKAIRDTCLETALEDVKQWFQEGKIAIVDATNTTVERRERLCQYAKQQRCDIFFIESFCDDLDIIDNNITKVKVNSPDYIGKSDHTICVDFQERIKNYESQYTPLDAERDACISFIRIINAGKRVEINNLNSPLKNRIARYLISIRLPPQTFYITRHGESVYNVENRIGGNSILSPQGRKYAETLGQVINGLQESGLEVWTSNYARTIETASLIKAPQRRWSALNEIQTGICSDMIYEEAEKKWPSMLESRASNKFYFRYPGGENYQDLIHRLEPLIFDLEQSEKVCVVGHRATIRCLLGYFIGSTMEEIPHICVPLHTLFKVTTTAAGYEFHYMTFPIPHSCN